MELPIPNKVKKLWDSWDLRVCILVSLVLQVFLMLFASFRQRCRSKLLLVFIWFAYLLADWIAAVAIGLITKSQGNHCDHEGHQDFLAFWASFLLLHLGGPDSITSFALEDNEFWLRHLFGLILQFLAALYSYFLTLPDNKLRFPTAIILVVGTIKFAERTAALYLASLEHFGETVRPKPNPGPDYEKTEAVYSSIRWVRVTIPTQAAETTTTTAGNDKDPTSCADPQDISESDEFKLLEKAHEHFESFKGLIIGILLSSNVRESSRSFFLRRSADEAFRLVENELNFIYDVLHTKIVVVRNKFGYTIRFLSSCSVFGAFLLFYCAAEKYNMSPKFDTVLTYSLLSGAMAQDMISVFKLIFSDWTLIILNSSLRKCVPSIILKKSRWSGSVSQYNIINYCLDERPKCLYTLGGYLYCKGILENVKIWWCQSSKTVDTKLKLFIFNELRVKSRAANNLSAAVEACAQRGIWALLQNSSSYNKLKWSILEFQYAESLLVWHIATEICYLSAESTKLPDDGSKEICKVLSDYMFYIMVAQPAMVAPVMGNWHIAFQDTCAEANRYFNKFSRCEHMEACGRILKVETKSRPADVKGNANCTCPATQ
nr:uncharacterized protein LOC107422203 [Ziziphus jujuba var. spinosa]